MADEHPAAQPPPGITGSTRPEGLWRAPFAAPRPVCKVSPRSPHSPLPRLPRRFEDKAPLGLRAHRSRCRSPSRRERPRDRGFCPGREAACWPGLEPLADPLRRRGRCPGGGRGNCAAGLIDRQSNGLASLGDGLRPNDSRTRPSPIHQPGALDGGQAALPPLSLRRPRQQTLPDPPPPTPRPHPRPWPVTERPARDLGPEPLERLGWAERDDRRIKLPEQQRSDCGDLQRASGANGLPGPEHLHGDGASIDIPVGPGGHHDGRRRLERGDLHLQLSIPQQLDDLGVRRRREVVIPLAHGVEAPQGWRPQKRSSHSDLQRRRPWPSAPLGPRARRVPRRVRGRRAGSPAVEPVAIPSSTMMAQRPCRSGRGRPSRYCRARRTSSASSRRTIAPMVRARERRRPHDILVLHSGRRLPPGRPSPAQARTGRRACDDDHVERGSQSSGLLPTPRGPLPWGAPARRPRLLPVRPVCSRSARGRPASTRSWNRDMTPEVFPFGHASPACSATGDLRGRDKCQDGRRGLFARREAREESTWARPST